METALSSNLPCTIVIFAFGIQHLRQEWNNNFV